MTIYRLATCAAVLTALALPVAPTYAIAEEMTAEDILKRLKAQRTRTLGFVDESKPADGSEEETAIAVAPEATDEAPSGLALTPTEDGSTTVTASTDESVSTTTATSVSNSGGDDSASAITTASATPAEAYVIDLTIYFDFDSAVLKAASKNQLNALCEAVRLDTGNGTYQIIGHTDAKGSASYNKRLSTSRADEVVRYMVSQCGIQADRLKAVGAGEEQLKFPEDPRNDENRRVEIQVLS
ncbi:MAG: OmpA family protein [Pseudomonadota bacterium]